MDDDTRREYLTTEEAASLCRRPTVDSFRRWAKKRNIPRLGMGKNLVWSRSELTDAMDTDLRWNDGTPVYGAYIDGQHECPMCGLGEDEGEDDKPLVLCHRCAGTLLRLFRQWLKREQPDTFEADLKTLSEVLLFDSSEE